MHFDYYLNKCHHASQEFFLFGTGKSLPFSFFAAPFTWARKVHLADLGSMPMLSK